MCHNAAGQGGALTYGKFAPEVTGLEAKHVYEAMETGPQNMPVFSDSNLSAQDKRDVITYLEKLEENGSPPGGISLGSLGPVTEGLYAWTIILALLTGTAVWLGGEGQVSSKHMNNNLDGSSPAKGVSASSPKEDGGFPNPGLPPARPPSGGLRSARREACRAHRRRLFLLSVVGTVVFILAYFLVTPTGRNIFAEQGSTEALWWSNLITGLGLAIAVFFIGAAAVHWAKTLMPDHEMVEERHALEGDEETREAAVGIIADGLHESGIGRRPPHRHVARGRSRGAPDRSARTAVHPGPAPPGTSSITRSGEQACASPGIMTERRSRPLRS